MEDDAISTLAAIERLAQMPDIIRKLVAAIDVLETAGLGRRVLVLMLQDLTKVPKKQIHAVLNALPLLADEYLTLPRDEDVSD